MDSISKSDGVRSRIRKALPCDYTTNYRYYLRCYMHAMGYFGIFGLSYYYQHQLFTKHPNVGIITLLGKKVELGSLLKYFFSPLIGWSLAGIYMIGHDGHHGVFGPTDRIFGKILNWLSDTILIPFVTQNHSVHSQARGFGHVRHEDLVILDYNIGTIGEILNTMFSGMQYNLYNLFEVLRFDISPFDQQGFKRWISKPYWLLMLFHRVSFLLGGAYYTLTSEIHANSLKLINYNTLVFSDNGNSSDNYTNPLKELIVNIPSPLLTIVNFLPIKISSIEYRPTIGLANSICLAFWFNVILFFPHANPRLDKRDDKLKDDFEYELDYTWEMYPTNSYYDQFQQFLHVGVTSHAAHHLGGHVPRSLLYIVSNEIKNSYSTKYREIKSFKQEFELYSNRIVYGFNKDIPIKIKQRNEVLDTKGSHYNQFQRPKT